LRVSGKVRAQNLRFSGLQITHQVHLLPAMQRRGSRRMLSASRRQISPDHIHSTQREPTTAWIYQASLQVLGHRCWTHRCRSRSSMSVQARVASRSLRCAHCHRAPSTQTKRLASGLVLSRKISNDPKILADIHGPTFDIVLADVPCSGQSLLARGLKNEGCFHDINVGKNTGRQRRILAECIRLCKPGGYIAYSTCTYAQSENESVVEWALSKHAGCSTVEIPVLNAHRSQQSSEFCYRLWPQHGFGAGAFLSLIQVGGDQT